MIDYENKREHLNLFYILKEDKEKNALTKNCADKMWLSIIQRTNINDVSPP